MEPIPALLGRLHSPAHRRENDGCLCLQNILVRLDPSSTTAEWHTLVYTCESILNGPDYDFADPVAYVDLSKAFPHGKPTPRQILDRTLAEIGEHNLAMIMVATERTFEPLREDDVSGLCVEEGNVLPEDVQKQIELLVIDRFDGEGEGDGDGDGDGDDDDEDDPQEHQRSRNPLHGYATLYGTEQDDGSVAICLIQLGEANMDMEELIECSRSDDY